MKFARYHTRNKIFRKKKLLKGKQVSITESLTKRRMAELKEAREKHGFHDVWTSATVKYCTKIIPITKSKSFTTKTVKLRRKL